MIRRLLEFCLAIATSSALLWPLSAGARTTLEAVRAKTYLQCGSVGRPGLAEVDAHATWSGLEVEICRAVAVAVFGPNARYAYHRYDADRDFDAVRAGGDQLVFLSAAEIAEQRLGDALMTGPPVFIETIDLLVAETSRARRARDLAGGSACFLISTSAEDALDAWLAAQKIELTRFAFREESEMYDAYDVQRCKAVVGEATALADARLDGGVNDLKSRLLPDHLAIFPILAATPKGDRQWAAIVAASIRTIVAADTHRSIDGAGLGLNPGWQTDVVETVGGHATIFERTLGSRSRLKLQRGLNAP